MKKFIIAVCAIICSQSYSQVGINTEHPKGALHIDGAKDNPTNGTVPNATQALNDFIMMPDGKVGIRNAAPAYSLDIQQNITTGTSSISSTANVALRLINPNTSKSIVQRFTAYNSLGLEKTFHFGIDPNALAGNGALHLGRPSNLDFRMDIANGNLGLGVEPNPTLRLRINGNMKVENTNDRYVTTFRVGADAAGYGNSSENKGIFFTTESSNNLGNTFVGSITSGGVGTGTSVDANRYINFNVRTEGDGTGLGSFNDAAMTLRSYSATDKRLGIGNTNPQARLDVNGSVKLGNDGDSSPVGTIRYNAASDKFQGRTSAGWVDLH